jgi:DNA adenine methylase
LNLTDRIRPAVRWPGGKSRLLHAILPHLRPHRCYVEPFAGGLAVLLAKPRSPVEVINDINGDLVTFYRCVRFHPDPLLTELEFVLNSRKEFDDFRHQAGLTDIQRSARWFFRNKTCFGGSDLNSFGTSPTSAMSSRANRLQAIRDLSYRLDKVTIENKPWEDLLRLYDRTETFFFLDPPYTDCSDTAYDAWDSSHIRRLRDAVFNLKGSWVVTLNDSQENRAIFSGCLFKAVSRPLGINGKAGARIYREIIIRPRAKSR